MWSSISPGSTVARERSTTAGAGGPALRLGPRADEGDALALHDDPLVEERLVGDAVDEAPGVDQHGRAARHRRGLRAADEAGDAACPGGGAWIGVGGGAGRRWAASARRESEAGEQAAASERVVIGPSSGCRVASRVSAARLTAAARTPAQSLAQQRPHRRRVHPGEAERQGDQLVAPVGHAVEVEAFEDHDAAVPERVVHGERRGRPPRPPRPRRCRGGAGRAAPRPARPWGRRRRDRSSTRSAPAASAEARQREHDARPDARLERHLVDRRARLGEVVRRVDVGAGVAAHRHVADVAGGALAQPRRPAGREGAVAGPDRDPRRQGPRDVPDAPHRR